MKWGQLKFTLERNLRNIFQSHDVYAVYLYILKFTRILFEA